MTKNNKFLIILLTILNSVMLIKGNELLELVCSTDTECRQFQHSGILSFCVYGHCVCSTSNGEGVECKPLDYKVNNIIGGPCPCHLDNSECDPRDQVCYCVKGYVPSVDKRRCLKETLALNERCEEHYQCQNNDLNAVCWLEYGICSCKVPFINEGGKCVSIVGFKHICTVDSDCTELHGPNSRCSSRVPYCICINNHYTSSNNNTCLKSMKYLQSCNESVQCIDALGLGGQCIDNLCQCAGNYFAYKKRSPIAGYFHTVCTQYKVRGQSCRYDEDCYDHHLTELDQTMICNYGECDCKTDYHVNEYNQCVPHQASLIVVSIVLIFGFTFMLFLNSLFVD